MGLLTIATATVQILETSIVKSILLQLADNIASGLP